MISRERVYNAVEFKSVDKPALECDVGAVALYEHGGKIRDLFRTIEGDFGPITEEHFRIPGPDSFDENGDFLEYRLDDWGVKWAYRIFGIQGHPIERPLDDWNNFETYRIPEIPKSLSESQGNSNKDYYSRLKEKGYFAKAGWFGFLEKACSLRKYEDVLEDLAFGDVHMIKLLDKLQERMAIEIGDLLESGVDGIQFGDDYGMQETMLLSPKLFRDTFKPRLSELIAPIKKAGKKVFFHSCGYVLPIIEDFKEIGVDAIWPQLNVYNMEEFAAYTRSIGIAVAIHPDRSNLLTKSTPDQVKREMNRYIEAFRPEHGGSWFYLEIDNGFPYANIESMVDVIKDIRK